MKSFCTSLRSHVENCSEATLLTEIVIFLSFIDLLLEEIWVDKFDSLGVCHGHGRDESSVGIRETLISRSASKHRYRWLLLIKVVLSLILSDAQSTADSE